MDLWLTNWIPWISFPVGTPIGLNSQSWLLDWQKLDSQLQTPFMSLAPKCWWLLILRHLKFWTLSKCWGYLLLSGNCPNSSQLSMISTQTLLLFHLVSRPPMLLCKTLMRKRFPFGEISIWLGGLETGLTSNKSGSV